MESNQLSGNATDLQSAPTLQLRRSPIRKTHCTPESRSGPSLCERGMCLPKIVLKYKLAFCIFESEICCPAFRTDPLSVVFTLRVIATDFIPYAARMSLFIVVTRSLVPLSTVFQQKTPEISFRGTLNLNFEVCYFVVKFWHPHRFLMAHYDCPVVQSLMANRW